MARYTVLLLVAPNGQVEAQRFASTDAAGQAAYTKKGWTRHTISEPAALGFLTTTQLGQLYTATLGKGAVRVLAVLRTATGLDMVFRALMGQR